MSPHAVNNFVSDLVLMAQAMEQLPAVKESLANAERENSALLDRIGNQQEHILKLKAEIDQHLASIRSLEVSRDDAELRFLELDEKANHVSNWARDIEALVGQIKIELTPPKPEPVSTIQDQAADDLAAKPYTWLEGSSSDQGLGADPLPETTRQAEHSWATSGGETTGEALVQRTEGSTSDPAPGQSEADPTTASSAHVDTNYPSAEHMVPNVSTGKYSNMLYSNCPYYVSEVGWIAGGGTEYSYRH